VFDTMKTLPTAGTASAFVVSHELPAAKADIWSQAGAAIELANRAPASHAVRVAIALALVVAARLCWAGGAK
jgi:hypothetical protein